MLLDLKHLSQDLRRNNVRQKKNELYLCPPGYTESGCAAEEIKLSAPL